MCQPKSKGGKRCSAHMHGSMAVVTHTSVSQGVGESEVRTVFRELRHEGKKLPAPNAEEVKAFAGGQRLRAQFDPQIKDERQRRTVQRRWARAGQETPDGGTFHAWRHTMSETMRRYQRKLTAVGLATGIAFAGASCSGQGGSMAERPAPSPSVSQTVEAPPAGLVGTGVIEDDGNGRGTYERVTLAEDSPLYQYDESIVNQDSVRGLYTPEDITSAQQVVSKFAVEEGLDSIVVDSERADEWVGDNADKFAPEYQEEMRTAASVRSEDNSMNAIIDNDASQRRENAGGYYVVNDGGSRIDSLSIKKDEIFAFESGALAIVYSGEVKRTVAVPEGSGTKEMLEPMKFTQAYSVIKDSNGEWKLTGWQNSYQYQPFEPKN